MPCLRSNQPEPLRVHRGLEGADRPAEEGGRQLLGHGAHVDSAGSQRRGGQGGNRFAKFFHGMLQEGVYFAPSQFEAGFISTAHGPLEIENTLTAARKVFATL